MNASIDPSHLATDEYDYRLPKELIAQQPASQRTDARLMVVDRERQSIDHWHVRDLPTLLDPGDCLVLNDTKVVPAKLIGHRTATGGRWHGLYLEADETGVMKLLCKTRGRLKPRETITLQDREGRDDIRLIALARLDGGSWAMMSENGESPDEVLKRVGRIPLPHYIRGGNMVDSDAKNYQTVYAQHDGSVAAPTAGLHFSDALLNELQQRGIQNVRVTLHVGVGTFAPIKSNRIDDHVMHHESGELTQQAATTLANCREQGGRIISVGSTSLRLLETAAKGGTLDAWKGETNLYVRPGHTFHAVNGLMTNFHLPRTTLLVMVRTFGGDELIKRAYLEAVEEQYRFFSYGDAMLIR